MDDKGTLDPNDDEEYLVAARVDGVLLAKATPPRAANPGTNAGLPASPGCLVTYFPEPNPEFSNGQASGSSQNAGGLIGLADFLNGSYDAVHNTLLGTPYFAPTGTGPTLRTWTSAETTNREVAVFHDTATGNYFIYSVNKWRKGLWVIPLSRVNGDLTGTATTWITSIPINQVDLGGCHNIYVDGTPSRAALYVTDDWNSRVCRIGLAIPSNPGANNGVLQIIASDTYHDAMVYRDQLFVSGASAISGLTTTWVYDLPISSPATPRSAFTEQSGQPGISYPGAHSVYVDTTTPFMEGRLYRMDEDLGQPTVKKNYLILSYDPKMQASAIDDGQLRGLVPYVNPTGLGLPTSPNIPQFCSPIHNLRGIGRTVFGAQYREGVMLLDFFNDETTAFLTSDPGYYTVASLGSFDTTSRQDGVVVPPPAGYPHQGSQPSWAQHATVEEWVLNSLASPGYYQHYFGCWDVAVTQDSGLIYASLGYNLLPSSQTEQFLTAGVFRVQQGHINRYWDSTPFPAQSPNASLGLVPRIVALQGPPREGKSLLLGDANGGLYAAVDAQNQPLQYQYTLIFSNQAPVGAGGSNPAVTPGAVMWDPDTSQGSNNNNVWLNVWDSSQVISNQWIRISPLTSPTSPSNGWFSFPSVGTQGTRWYCQLLVQEWVLTGSPPTAQKTGRWAASRGHWFGVARP